MQVTVLLETFSGKKQRQFLEQRIIDLLGTASPFEMSVKSLYYDSVPLYRWNMNHVIFSISVYLQFYFNFTLNENVYGYLRLVTWNFMSVA